MSKNSLANIKTDVPAYVKTSSTWSKSGWNRRESCKTNCTGCPRRAIRIPCRDPENLSVWWVRQLKSIRASMDWISRMSLSETGRVTSKTTAKKMSTKTPNVIISPYDNVFITSVKMLCYRQTAGCLKQGVLLAQRSHFKGWRCLHMVCLEEFRTQSIQSCIRWAY